MAKVFQVDTDGTLTTNLRAYYQFQTNSNDFTDNARNGVDTNTPTYTAGKVSNALTCVAASSQYISIPNAAIAWGTPVISINFWFKLAATDANMALAPMTGTTGKGLLIYYAGGVLTFSKPNVADCNYTWAGKDTNWHMLTCVGRSNGNDMETYLDGTSVATNQASLNFVNPYGVTLTIGEFKWGGLLQAGWYLGGQIDELGFWDKSLSTQEIADLYNSGNGQTMIEPITRGAAFLLNFL